VGGLAQCNPKISYDPQYYFVISNIVNKIEHKFNHNNHNKYNNHNKHSKPTMDIIKYRKLYLSENWGGNRFNMIRKIVDLEQQRRPFSFTIDLQRNHPLVLSGNAYWITHDQLCIGYELNEKSEVFRPIFSHKRQRLMDILIPSIKNPVKFWKNLKSRYFLSMVKIKKLPIVCIDNIVMYIY